MTQAIYYRARMIGADGVIDAGQVLTQNASQGGLYFGQGLGSALAFNALIAAASSGVTRETSLWPIVYFLPL